MKKKDYQNFLLYRISSLEEDLKWLRKELAKTEKAILNNKLRKDNKNES